MSTTTTPPLMDPATILEESKPRSPKKCHTIDHRGWALCGAYRRQPDENGDRLMGLHHRDECRRRGHQHCVTCDELKRQLGDHDAMAA